MISAAVISDGASRRRPTNPRVTNTAIRPPAPKAALSTPTPESPIPSSPIASTTNSTSIAPKKSDWEVSTATSVAVPRSPASALKPSSASASGERSSCGSAGGRLRVSGTATQAEIAIPTANTTITVPGPPNVITRGAISGPTTAPALSIHPNAAFPAVSSSGVCTATGQQHVDRRAGDVERRVRRGWRTRTRPAAERRDQRESQHRQSDRLGRVPSTSTRPGW